MKKTFAVLLLFVFVFLCYISVSNPAGAYMEVRYDAVSSSRLSGNFYRSSGAYAVLTSGQIGGKVIPSYSDCAPGTVVNLIVKPLAGYEPISVCAVNSSGDLLEILYEDGQYSFVMPDSIVFVDVVFQLLRS